MGNFFPVGCAITAWCSRWLLWDTMVKCRTSPVLGIYIRQPAGNNTCQVKQPQRVKQFVSGPGWVNWPFAEKWSAAMSSVCQKLHFIYLGEMWECKEWSLPDKGTGCIVVWSFVGIFLRMCVCVKKSSESFRRQRGRKKRCSRVTQREGAERRLWRGIVLRPFFFASLQNQLGNTRKHPKTLLSVWLAGGQGDGK